MAQINDTTEYPITTPTTDDYLIGTNGADGRTKNFTVASILALGAGVTDGDKGDVTVSGSGSVWTVDALPESRITGLVNDLALKAPLVSPTFTGIPAAPTATPGTNTTQLATTAFVAAAAAAATVADGNKGDVVVSGSGAVWSIDSSVITSAARTVLDDVSTSAMLATLGGVPTGRTLTINGVTQSLAANRSWTVGDAIKADNNTFTGQNAFGADAVIGSSSFYGSGYRNIIIADEVYDFDVSPLYYLEGIGSYITIAPTVDAPSTSAYSVDAEIKIPAGNTKDFAQITAMYGSSYHFGTGDVNAIYALEFYAGPRAASNVNIVAGINVGSYNEGATVTTQSGSHIDVETYGGGSTGTRRILHLTNYTDSATVTHDRGIEMDAVNAGSSSNYAFYTHGGEHRYLTGAAGVVGLSLQRFTSQTAHLINALDTDGSTLTYMDENGVWSTSAIPDLAGIYQPFSSELSAIAFLGTTGVVQRTGPGTYAAGNITQGSVIGLIAALDESITYAMVFG